MDEDLIVNVDKGNELIIDINDNYDELVIEENETIGSSNNYNDLYNKPQINEVELKGNKSLDELGIQKKGSYANKRVTNIEIDNLFN